MGNSIISRYTLNSGQNIKLAIQKGKLEISITVPGTIICAIPCLTLSPTISNGNSYGYMSIVIPPVNKPINPTSGEYTYFEGNTAFFCSTSYNKYGSLIVFYYD